VGLNMGRLVRVSLEYNDPSKTTLREKERPELQ
jgi:hypothetical protein